MVERRQLPQLPDNRSTRLSYRKRNSKDYGPLCYFKSIYEQLGP